MSLPHQRDRDSLGLVLTRPDPRETRLWVSGEVDLLTAPSLAGALRRAVRTVAEEGPAEAHHLTCDLDDVTFFGASGLHALVEADADARAHGVDLMIVAARGAARRSLSLTALDRTLSVIGGRHTPPATFSLS